MERIFHLTIFTGKQWDTFSYITNFFQQIPAASFSISLIVSYFRTLCSFFHYRWYRLHWYRQVRSIVRASAFGHFPLSFFPTSNTSKVPGRALLVQVSFYPYRVVLRVTDRNTTGSLTSYPIILPYHTRNDCPSRSHTPQAEELLAESASWLSFPIHGIMNLNLMML